MQSPQGTARGETAPLHETLSKFTDQFQEAAAPAQVQCGPGGGSPGSCPPGAGQAVPGGSGGTGNM